jgi:hypothetical protein
MGGQSPPVACVAPGLGRVLCRTVSRVAVDFWAVRLSLRRPSPYQPTAKDVRMLGRKNYTQEELDHAKTAIDQQLAAYKMLVKAVDDAAPSDPKVTSALEAFEPLCSTT